MSYDHEKALAAGYIVKCGAPLVEPLTVSGIYRCASGHGHVVERRGDTFTVSGIGYEAVFLAAVVAAEDIAIDQYGAGTGDYWAVYNRILRERGYGDVVLPTPASHFACPG